MGVPHINQLVRERLVALTGRGLSLKVLKRIAKPGDYLRALNASSPAMRAAKRAEREARRAKRRAQTKARKVTRAHR